MLANMSRPDESGARSQSTPMVIRTTKNRMSLANEGLLAGFTLALCDWIAAGPWRMPLVLAALSFAILGGVGLAMGLVAGALRRPGLAFGVLLALGNGLNVLSLASKDLALSRSALVGSAVCLGGIGVAIVALLLSQTNSSRGPVRGALISFASIPAGTLLWNLFPKGLLALGVIAVLPALALFVALRANWKGTIVAGINGMVCIALALPVFLEPRPFLRSAVPAKGTTADGKVAASAPNVVLIVIDTLRADRVTPEGDGALAQLAREGVYFEQAISPAPWTLPAMGSLMTGLYPSQHGAVSARNPLPADVTTLAERFRESGYSTAAFTGGAFVGPAHRMDQGFEHFDPNVERSFPAFRTYVPLLWRVAKNRFAPLFGIVRAVREYRGLRGGLDAVRAWHPEPERPFFLFVHSYQVHDYYLYDPRTDDAVRDRRTPPPRFAKRFSVHPDELSYADADELDWFRAIYDERLSDVERSIGELLRLVRERSGERDLVIALTSDHGEGFDVKTRRVHHGGRLHDDLLRVPLLLQGPGLAPRRVAEQVGTLDLAPTLLELAGLEPLRDIAGRSLLGAIRGEESFADTLFAEEWEHQAELLALRRSAWKWIQGPGQDEVYDLAQDADERSNLGEGPKELAERMKAFRSTYPLRSTNETELDARTQQQLKNLGYTGDDSH